MTAALSREMERVRVFHPHEHEELASAVELHEQKIAEVPLPPPGPKPILRGGLAFPSCLRAQTAPALSAEELAKSSDRRDKGRRRLEKFWLETKLMQERRDREMKEAVRRSQRKKERRFEEMLHKLDQEAGLAKEIEGYVTLRDLTDER